MIGRILTFATRQPIIDLLSGLNLEKKKYKLTLKEFHHKRTNQQNNLLWKWHAEVAAELSAFTGKHWTPEAVHYRLFCPKFLNGEVVELPDGSKAWVSETSSTQDVMELSEAMTKYQVWCIENSIDITDPENEFSGG